MKALVVYCSRTGHTDALAREIAARCGADVERIRDAGVDRSGLLGYLRSGWQAWSGHATQGPCGASWPTWPPERAAPTPDPGITERMTP